MKNEDASHALSFNATNYQRRHRDRAVQPPKLSGPGRPIRARSMRLARCGWSRCDECLPLLLRQRGCSVGLAAANLKLHLPWIWIPVQFSTPAVLLVVGGEAALLKPSPVDAANFAPYQAAMHESRGTECGITRLISRPPGFVSLAPSLLCSCGLNPQLETFIWSCESVH